ncbi:MAG: hypothetical protein K1X86_05070 [Ignavibacteria bacterium]|nr:hypothetical protein [Ignavibacteria bacterium]
MKEINKDSLNILFNFFIGKYRNVNNNLLHFTVYDKEFPKQTISKIDSGLMADSKGNKHMTLPPKGTKSTKCFYWCKTEEMKIGEIFEEK